MWKTCVQDPQCRRGLALPPQHTPRGRCFTLNKQWYQYTSVYWGWQGRRRRRRKGALPSLHGARTRPPGKPPRSVKVKDLTPQKKRLRNGLKNTPPTKTATSDATLMKNFHFSWGGGAVKRHY